jgi:hypothetical protein
MGDAMTTITVWILMIYGGSSYRWVYSPPVATEESCLVMKKVAEAGSHRKMECVKVEVYK